MVKEIELKLLPEDLEQEERIREKVLRKIKLPAFRIKHIEKLRRSIDARGKVPFFRLRFAVYIDEPFIEAPNLISTFQHVGDKKSALIIGAGPAGYFAALELIERGIKPIIFDRGKDVRARRRDLRAIQQFGMVDENSNYCFGEGGAGTYSDGKLYTRSHKRGSIYKALKLLVEHGAKSDILIDAHPHIGSNKLPKIVSAIRETILKFGGEIHFNSLVTDILIKDNSIIGLVVNQEKEVLGDTIILATGHSARDIYTLLDHRGVQLEAKPFALGVRIEHAQGLIDKIQYGYEQRPTNLPASSYRLAAQVEGRGVFSFCMCPGGLVVPAATAPGEIVVNGMSLSRRDSPYANSGTVVAVEPEDLKVFEASGVFAGLEFQKQVEKRMFAFGDGSQKAPAQRLDDFVNGKISSSLPATSYIPGLIAAPLHDLLPSSIYQRLRKGVLEFDKKMKGYYTTNAVVIGTESRTSSPVRIPRSRETYMHPEVSGLFPCGEGAGYAGGIISAAMDGQNVAAAVATFLNSTIN